MNQIILETGNKISLTQRSEDASFNKETSEKQVLCIYTSGKIISYIIFEPEKKHCSLFKSYGIKFAATKDYPDLNSIKALNQELNFSFKKTILLHLAPKFALIPESIYNKNNAEDIFFYSNELKSNEKLFTNYIPSAKVYMIFAIDSLFAAETENAFKELVHIHAGTALIEVLMKMKSENEKDDVIINLENGFLQLIIRRNNKLHYYNIFKYKTTEDILYYTLYSSEQNGSDPHKDNFYLSGINEDRHIFIDLLKKYIKNLHISDFPAQLNNSPVLKDCDQNLHFNLISAMLCE